MPVRTHAEVGARRASRCVAGFACATALLGATLAGCAVPKPQAYEKPTLQMPAAWTLEAPWREGRPSDALDKGPWWTSFGDAQLDALIGRALKDNLTLTIAGARLLQARAALDVARAALAPQVAANSRVSRLDISANRPLTNYAAPNFSTTQNDFQVGLAATYEIDLFGRVRASIEGAGASAEQAAADLENVRLVLSADIATAYYNLRSVDNEIDAVQRNIALQNKALALARTRYELGAASGLDIAQQQSLLDATLAQVDLLRRQRSLFEHALATLVGAPAPLFAVAPAPGMPSPPTIPIGVPSDVLERRPDVAAAERAMAAANAQVGLAQVAFYPSVVLGPNLGLDSRTLPNLLSASSVLWALGVSATQVLFDGGRLKANEAFARAGYEAVVATYRRTVLLAMQEVEDGITSLASLERAAGQTAVAVASARKVLDLASARYEGGVATALEVITAQQALVASERQAAQIQGQRMLSAVFLVRALGGGWRAKAPAAAAPGPSPAQLATPQTSKPPSSPPKSPPPSS